MKLDNIQEEIVQIVRSDDVLGLLRDFAVLARQQLNEHAKVHHAHNLAHVNLGSQVAECTVSQGPTLKRVRPRAQGRAFRINKKTSHITLVLKEME